MQSKPIDTENTRTEYPILFINPAFPVELHPENAVSPREADFYDAAADDGFAQNTTAWD